MTLKKYWGIALLENERYTKKELDAQRNDGLKLWQPFHYNEENCLDKIETSMRFGTLMTSMS